jgi:HEAT repeat protein
MSSEIRQMKEMIVLAELNQPSPNERIRAINQIKAYGSVDERTIAMLLNVLSNDSNTNVRLVAIEALVAHADRTIVKQGLIQALDHQESPLVQLALTDAVVDLKEKQAIGPLQSMLEREDLNYVVRTKIENSLSLLM